MNTMKTKLITLTYKGSGSVDPRFSFSMLPWTIADITSRNRERFTRLSVGIENGALEAYNSDFELQFAHHLKHIVSICRVIAKPSIKKNTEFTVPKHILKTNAIDNKDNIYEIYGPENGMIYLLKNPRDPLLHIHLFECELKEEMAELMQQMRDPNNIGGSVGSIPQTFVGNGDMSLQSALRSQGSHSTPASNLKSAEAMRNAHHDGSPSLVSNRMSISKSYTSGLSHSASAVNVPNSNSNSNLSLYNDISASNSQFFEVMYVGKIRVSHKRVPFTFIDDALPKFKAYDAQKIKLQIEENRRNSIISEGDSTEGISTSQRIEDDKVTTPGVTDIDQLHLQLPHTISAKIDEEKDEENGESAASGEAVDHRFEDNKENTSPPISEKFKMRRQSHITLPSKKDPMTSSSSVDVVVPIRRDRSASIGSIPIVEQNRTMVFLIGKSELRLISPDRKQVLLYKDFKDVASCAQGQKNPDHFGIICRDSQNDGYIGYVFKCQSEHVADEIIVAITQAFYACSEQKQKEKMQIFSCEHCPMLWYHKLCSDLEAVNDKKMQSVIFRRMETLSDVEQNSLMAKYYGAEEVAGHSVIEQNQFLMMLLRAHCEAKQQRHVHDTAENRSEFLNQYLGGSTIFMKAKRSLTSSFDHLLKRKASKDDFSNPIKESASSEAVNKNENQNESVGFRPRSSTLNSSPSLSRKNSDFGNNIAPQLKSPMMDIFIKVGNSPKENSSHTGSWRQAMLHRVVTPSKNIQDETEFMSPLRCQKNQPKSKRTKEELRELWKIAIKQTIILSRMEKENARLQERQNEHEIKRIKLEYEDITVCSKQSADMWDTFFDSGARVVTKKDPKVLLNAIKNGVPRTKRGDVWLFLAEQKCLHSPPMDIKNYPNFNTPYHAILKNLTEHQHAIFIDLGRTFPDHKYYKDALGIGQLALFNLLKAYSILDPELGYCQGLAFICGVLLLHLEEADAFHLLKHLMFKRQMRAKYLPDMKQFQLQLYQLSRLLKDNIPDLYDWLDENEISPTLYAAPWILTVFSSHFPLGFVARVFDLLFLESFEVIFRVALALLDYHKDEILKRENFEEIMDYLKNVVPKIDAEAMEKIFKYVFTTDISKQLNEYQVEYNVLQEEISSQNHHLDTLNRVKENNQQLETELHIAQTSITHLDQSRQNLQSQVQALETNVQMLGKFISQLANSRSDVELTSEVKAILHGLNLEQFNKKRPIMMIDRKLGKSMSVNSNLGLTLKVLEEGNESTTDASAPSTPGTAPARKKTPFFENTFEQIRQQKAGLRLNKLNENPLLENKTLDANLKLPEHVEKAVNSMRSPNDIDSGIATPISPQSKTLVEQTEQQSCISVHPLGNCGNDVNIRFNGTTQLKTIRPIHNIRPANNSNNNVSNVTPRTIIPSISENLIDTISGIVTDPLKANNKS